MPKGKQDFKYGLHIAHTIPVPGEEISQILISIEPGARGGRKLDKSERYIGFVTNQAISNLVEAQLRVEKVEVKPGFIDAEINHEVNRITLKSYHDRPAFGKTGVTLDFAIVDKIILGAVVRHFRQTYKNFRIIPQIRPKRASERRPVEGPKRMFGWGRTRRPR